MLLTPSRGSKPKRSYLDKGPTKEQVERRNLLKGKLAYGDDDEDDSGPLSPPFQDDEAIHGDLPLTEGSGRNSARTARERSSMSLSPKSLGRRVLGRSRGERTEQTSKRRPPERSKSHTGGTHHPKSTLEESRSMSPGALLKRSVFKLQGSSNSSKETGLDDMRKSLMDDKKQLDSLESKFQNLEDDAPDDETLLERVARRVAARRGKIQRTKTEGDDIQSMQLALKRRQEMERQDDQEIGGLWAMGLKALEKVYDDINSTRREYEDAD